MSNFKKYYDITTYAQNVQNYFFEIIEFRIDVYNKTTRYAIIIITSPLHFTTFPLSFTYIITMSELYNEIPDSLKDLILFTFKMEM